MANITGSGFGDTLDGTADNDRILGLNGDDRLSGFAGDDELEGGSDDDRLDGGSGRNILRGGSGDDSFINSSGDDTIEGGTGHDIVIFDYITNDSQPGLAARVNYRIDLLSGSGFFSDDLPGGTFFTLGNDIYSGIEEFRFEHSEPAGSGSQNDVFFDSNFSHILRLGGGNDFADGRGGSDTIFGDSGNDRLTGGTDNDQLFGGTGSDSLTGGSGADVLNGGSGVDTANYDLSSGVDIDLTRSTQLGGDAQGDSFVSIETIFGSRVSDQIRGGAGDDLLFGGLGNDVLEGRAGADTLNGGGNADTASYASSQVGVSVQLDDPNTGASSSAFFGDAAGDKLISIEDLIGSGFNDDLFGSSGNNVLSGGAGADRIFGGSGDDILAGGLHNDTLDGQIGNDTADFSSATARLVITLGANGASGRAVQLFRETDTLNSIENVIGSRFGDQISGNEFANRLRGEAGDDVFKGSVGNDQYIGGDGLDTLDLSSDATAATVRLDSGSVSRTSTNERDSLTSVERVIGTQFNDTFTSSRLGSIMVGNRGDDTYFVRNAADQIRESVSGGLDTVISGQSFALEAGQEIEQLTSDNVTGTTVLNFVGNEFGQTIVGNNGDNRLDGAGGADALIGNGGVDTATYENAAADVRVDLLNLGFNTNDAEGDTYSSIENLTGTFTGDILRADNGDNIIRGEGGNDTLVGRGGSDTLSGGAGFDIMAGGVDSDTYFAGEGEGDDRIQDSGGANDLLRVEALSDIVSSTRVADNLVLGLSDGDTITVANHFLEANRVESLSDGATTVVLAAGLVGGDASGLISGTNGNEVLDGHGGDDLLFAGGGDDWLIGGTGKDRLDGGAGANILTGGSGSDTFIFARDPFMDLVTDFQPGIDILAFSRASFGFDPMADIGDVLLIGGHRPREGEALYITKDGFVLYDDNWATLGGREIIAQLVGVQARDIDAADVLFV